MTLQKQRYAVVTQEGFEDNIHIPLAFDASCTAYKIVNESETATVSVTVKGTTVSYPPGTFSQALLYLLPNQG